MSNEDEGLYEDVKSAYAAAEELQETTDVEEASADSQSVEDVVRDEAGRFKAKQEAQTGDAPVQAVADEQPASPVELSVDKPPQSWLPAAREKWAALDPDIRQEIIRRETASANGVRQLQEKFAPAGQFIDQMRPVAAEAQSVGMEPTAYIHTLAMSERTLRTADMPAKVNELLRIADQYGIPLRDALNTSAGQEVFKAPKSQQMQIPPEFQRELQEMRQWREEQVNNSINTELSYFSQDKEFFEDVRYVMADLVERGMAKDLPTAYDQACWMVPEVRQVLLARQGQQQVTSQVATRQAKAAGASIPASGKVAVVSDDDDGDDISATVRKAFISAQGRS